MALLGRPLLGAPAAVLGSRRAGSAGSARFLRLWASASLRLSAWISAGFRLDLVRVGLISPSGFPVTRILLGFGLDSA